MNLKFKKLEKMLEVMKSNKLIRSTEVQSEDIKVYSTRNYNLFKEFKRNRCVSKAHVKELAESMSRKVLFSPIVVNSSGFVIDGQHRLEACRNLKIPVKYVVMKDYGVDEIMEYNKSLKSWSLEDFVNSYAEDMVDTFVTMRAIRIKYGIAASTQINLYNVEPNGNQSVKLKAVKNGELIIKNSFRECEIRASIYNRLKIELDKKELMHTRNSLTAVIKNLPDYYDNDKMLHKIKIYKGGQPESTKPAYYKVWFEEVYNYKSRTQVKLF